VCAVSDLTGVCGSGGGVDALAKEEARDLDGYVEGVPLVGSSGQFWSRMREKLAFSAVRNSRI
jgi:hypothetical protein